MILFNREGVGVSCEGDCKYGFAELENEFIGFICFGNRVFIVFDLVFRIE